MECFIEIMFIFVAIVMLVNRLSNKNSGHSHSMDLPENDEEYLYFDDNEDNYHSSEEYIDNMVYNSGYSSEEYDDDMDYEIDYEDEDYDDSDYE